MQNKGGILSVIFGIFSGDDKISSRNRVTRKERNKCNRVRKKDYREVKGNGRK